MNVLFFTPAVLFFFLDFGVCDPCPFLKWSPCQLSPCVHCFLQPYTYTTFLVVLFTLAYYHPLVTPPALSASWDETLGVPV